MLKRITAILLLLLANTALLAHAVIPHHHHSNVAVCISKSCCEHDTDVHDLYPDGTHECEHSKHSCCVLEKADVVEPNTSKHECGDILCSTFGHDDLSLFQAVLPHDSIFEPDRLGGVPFRQKPPVLSGYIAIVGTSIGLRAPPFFS